MIYRIPFSNKFSSNSFNPLLDKEPKEEGFRLKDIFKQVDIPEATYHYHMKNFFGLLKQEM